VDVDVDVFSVLVNIEGFGSFSEEEAGDRAGFWSGVRRERIDQLEPHAGYPGRPSSSSLSLNSSSSLSLSVNSVL